MMMRHSIGHMHYVKMEWIWLGRNSHTPKGDRSNRRRPRGPPAVTTTERSPAVWLPDNQGRPLGNVRF